MNLAIDYLLRSGELQSNLKFPYSLFVTSADGADKKVVTIYNGFQDGHLVVKHWHLSGCDNVAVPPFTEHQIAVEDLFVSEATVLPGYDPLWYAADPFETGGSQRSDEPMASHDEEEYNTAFSRIYNSKKHVKARGVWFRDLFAELHGVSMTRYRTVSPDAFLAVLKNDAPHLTHRWTMWRKYMLDFSMEPGEVAGELLLHDQYRRNAEAAGRAVGPFPEIVIPIPELKWDLGGYSFSSAPSLYNMVYQTATTTSSSGFSWNNYYSA